MKEIGPGPSTTPPIVIPPALSLAGFTFVDATIFPDSTWVLSDIKSSAESRKCLILSNYKFYRKKRRF